MSNSYEKEISEWSENDLSNWLISNNLRSLADICKRFSITGYDIFFITENHLRDEMGMNKFHDRQLFLKVIQQLIFEHLKLTITSIDTNESIILSLDNDPKLRLGELSNYISKFFNMQPNDIIYKDSYNENIISPSDRIVNMMILFPFKFKNILISSIHNNNNINNHSIINRTTNFKSHLIKKELSEDDLQFPLKKLSGKESEEIPKVSDIKYNTLKGTNNNAMNEMFSTMKNGEFIEDDIIRERDELNLKHRTINSNENYTPKYQKSHTPKRRNNIYNNTPLNKNSTFTHNNFYTSKNYSFQNVLNDIPLSKNSKNITNNNNNHHNKGFNLNNKDENLMKNEIKNDDKKDISLLSLNTNDPKGIYNDEMNKNSIPIDFKYKSEKRIYRDRKKPKEIYDNNSDFLNANNNLICSQDSMISGDNDDIKFKPSYPSNNNNKYIPRSNDNNMLSSGSGLNNTFMPRQNYQLNNNTSKKENNWNKQQSTKPFLQNHRIYNEDLLDGNFSINHK